MPNADARFKMRLSTTTKQELEMVLLDSTLFSVNEVQEILCFLSVYSISRVVVACQVLNIPLIGSDIDILIALASY